MPSNVESRSPLILELTVAVCSLLILALLWLDYGIAPAAISDTIVRVVRDNEEAAVYSAVEVAIRNARWKTAVPVTVLCFIILVVDLCRLFRSYFKT